MYKVKKFQDSIPGFGTKAEKRFEMIRKLSKNFTVKNETALQMDELLFDELNDSKNADFKLKGPNVFSEENKALESAITLIEDDVIGGRTVAEIKASHAGFSNGQEYVYISKGKVHVDKLGGKKVKYSFPIQYLYNEIMESTGREYTNEQIRKSPKPMSKPKSSRPKISYEKAKKVEMILEEVKFIKRYVMLHKKKVEQKQVLSLLNSLQRAILERRIRKDSKYAKEIKYMQEKLIGLYNFMRKNKRTVMEVEIEKKTLESFTKIAGSLVVMAETNILKRYIGLQGKEIDKEKAEKLISALERAAKNGNFEGDDAYLKRINVIYDSLYKFVEKAKKGDRLELHENALNGIESVLGCAENPDCGCDDEDNSLRGIEPTTSEKPARNLMNSMDFAKMEFETLGFRGKWLDLIGDPAEGFTAMVFGKPKMGKSFLCIDFAGYLARNHGKTLYVAKEEKLDKTLQDKLNDKNVKHPMLDVSDYLPEDLSDYEFIFLDSVNTLGLNPDDLRALKEQNPTKSFIYIFQTTKEGNFRGANTFQHDVDVVIEIPERGKAVQFGRFNQGGEMEIFKQIT